MQTFNFSFIGRQSGAIGVTYKIKDKYTAKNIGEALFMLWTDYELIKDLICNGNIVHPNEGLIKCVVPKRETNPTTGSYFYTRSNTKN